MFDWQKIDTVLLDMDGTLLDLHFDNHFWLEYVPRRYAEARGIDLAEARQAAACALPGYRRARWTGIASITGRASWGWTSPCSRKRCDHLIGVHPHVTDFLDLLAQAGKRRVLVTNAHQKSLELKMRRTRLGERLDHVVCAHDLGLPKEDQGFWVRLRRRSRSTRSARCSSTTAWRCCARHGSYGIANLLAILRPDTRQAERQVDEFPAVPGFGDLLDELRRQVD